MPLGCCNYSAFVNATMTQKFGTIILVVTPNKMSHTMLFLIAPSKAVSITLFHISSQLKYNNIFILTCVLLEDV